MDESEQPVEESLEARLAGHFGADDQPDEEETEQPPEQADSVEAEPESPPEPDFAEVEYEGATYKVPPPLKDAIMRNADYTRKTQELADRGRQVELQQQQIRAAELQQKFQQSIADEMNQMARLEATLEQFKALNWDDMSTESMIRNKHQMDLLREQREAIVKAIDGKRGEWMEQQKKQHETFLEQGREYLRKSIPNWSPDLAKGLSEYAISEGFTSDEVGAIADPRIVRTLWKARQYDELSKKAVAAKDKPAPVVKPSGVKPMPKDVKDKLNFRKALKSAKSDHDRKALIHERLADKFGG